MRWLWAVVTLWVLWSVGMAQQATITAVVRVVEHQKAGTPQWLPSRIGTTLENGDRVRTSKRSYAEVTFADKSVVKLNERSELTFHSAAARAQELELQQGNLWARFVKGAKATVRAKAVVAAVRGTTVLIAILPDGSVLIRAIEGILDVTLPDGRVVPVSQGQEITIPPIFQPGQEVAIKPAPPTQFADDPVPTDEPVTEQIHSGTQIVVTPGADGFAIIRQELNPGTNSIPETIATLSPGEETIVTLPTPVVPTILEVTVRGRQTILESSGISLTGEGRHFIGFRVRPRGTVGTFFYSLAILPVTDLAGTTRTRWIEGYVAYKDPQWGMVRVGRQWLTQSPVTTTVAGTLLPSEIADAIAWRKDFRRIRLDLAYLYDARPYAPGRQQGGYFRLSTPIAGGRVGIGLARIGGGGTSGYSADFSFPVIKNELDFYGETGRDPWLRDEFISVGVYFPGLFQRYNTDLFVEFSRRPKPFPSLISLRCYQPILPGLRFALTASRRGRSAIMESGTDFSVGLIYSTQFELR